MGGQYYTFGSTACQIPVSEYERTWGRGWLLRGGAARQDDVRVAVDRTMPALPGLVLESRRSIAGSRSLSGSV